MSIFFETDLPAGPDVVFAHLTDSALLTQWWPSGAQTDPAPGGGYHLWWDGSGWHLRGEYLVVEAPHSLTFTWAWDHEETPPRRVDISIEPREDGSHVTIRHESGSEEEGAGYMEGWEHFTGQLGEVLDPKG